MFFKVFKQIKDNRFEGMSMFFQRFYMYVVAKSNRSFKYLLKISCFKKPEKTIM